MKTKNYNHYLTTLALFVVANITTSPFIGYSQDAIKIQQTSFGVGKIWEGQNMKVEKIRDQTFILKKDGPETSFHSTKNATVTLHFDIIPDYVGLINETVSESEQFLEEPILTFEVPEGIYDIGAQFYIPSSTGEVIAWVIYENVTITEMFDTTILSTDAKNKVELASYDKNGTLLTLDNLRDNGKDDRYYLKFPKEYRFYTLALLGSWLYPADYILVSDLSERYQIWTARELASEDSFYFLKNNLSNGLHSDTVLVNDPSDYTLLNQRFQLTPAAGNNCYVVVDELLSYRGEPIMGIEHGAGDIMPYSPGEEVKIYFDNKISQLTEKDGFDYFARPCVWEDEPDYTNSKKIQSELLILDENRNVMNVGRWYDSFDFAVLFRNIFPFHALSYDLGANPSYSLGAETPFTHCQHLNNVGGMMPNAIFSFYYYLGQYNESRQTDNFYSALNIKHNGNVVYNDTLSKFVQPLMMDEAALVKETITNNNYVLAGKAGSNTTVLSFDQNNADCDPPSLTALRILNSENKINNTLYKNEDASIILAAGDYGISEDFTHFEYKTGTTLSLSYKPYSEDTWENITLSELPESFDSLYGKVYTASFSQVLAQVNNDSTYIDLKIALTDEQGNSEEQILHPAFLVKTNGASGLSDFSANPLWDIYPNPVRDILTIEYSGNEPYRINILNIMGGMIYNGTVSNKRSENINLKSLNLPDGIYLIQLISNSRTIVKKIIYKN